MLAWMMTFPNPHDFLITIFITITKQVKQVVRNLFQHFLWNILYK